MQWLVHSREAVNPDFLPGTIAYPSASRFLPNLHTAEHVRCAPGRSGSHVVFFYCRPFNHRNNPVLALASSRREPVFQQGRAFIYLIKKLVYKIVVVVNAAVNCG
jgi:hypothetical protein